MKDKKIERVKEGRKLGEFMQDKWAQSMLQPMYVINVRTGETIASVAEESQFRLTTWSARPQTFKMAFP
jgi:hypothetical protein